MTSRAPAEDRQFKWGVVSVRPGKQPCPHRAPQPEICAPYLRGAAAPRVRSSPTGWAAQEFGFEQRRGPKVGTVSATCPEQPDPGVSAGALACSLVDQTTSWLNVMLFKQLLWTQTEAGDNSDLESIRIMEVS